ncbi:MAG: DUF6364 family protein [Sulfuricaulis sp.]
MKKNITLRLDRDLLRKVKIIAASRETSVSRLLSDKLEEIIYQGEQYERARRAAFADLDEGFHFGGKRISSRDVLYER